MTTAAADVFDPQLLRSLRAAPWRTVEKRFLFILAASIAVHIVFATYVAAQPMPIPTDVPLDELQDRFTQRITLPPLLPIPKPVVAVAPAPSHPPQISAPAKPVDKGAVARGAVLKVLGSVGPGGVFADLLDAPVDEIAQALKGAKGIETASVAPTGPKGPLVGKTATIETMGTDGAKQVALGARLDKGPATAVPGKIVIEDGDDIDPRVLQQFITARRAAVQSCYERELHHNPGMKGGKVVLRMAIGTSGRVSAVSIEEDTLGSDAVSSCMTTLMSRWIFPVTPKDEIPLSVPFIFARAN